MAADWRETGMAAMVDSINTNNSAALNIQQLAKTKKELNGTQNRISTGLKISGPKDNAAIFAVSQILAGQAAGTTAVRASLNSAESTVGVAVSAGQQVSDLLTDIKAKAVQANDPSLSSSARQQIDAEFQQLTQQLQSVVAGASFGGVNLIGSGASDFSVLSSENGDSFNVSAQDLSLQGLGIDSLSLASSGGAASALSAINSAIDTASARVANLGSSAQRVDEAATFTTRLDNILRAGIGNLVDANLGEESAGLAAQSVKQQLGLRSLAIANAGPKALLSLFPGGSD